MSANCVSFEAFKALCANATTVMVGANGIHFQGLRFNDRKLRRWTGLAVKVAVDTTGPLGTSVIVLTLCGEFICNAWQKRPYNDETHTFVRAMDFNKRALRKLYAKGPLGWRGVPWHRLMAQVQMDIILDAEGQRLLTWSGGAR